MAQPPRLISQSKETLLKSYQKRLKDDIRAMVDNYMEILQLAKVRGSNPLWAMSSFTSTLPMLCLEQFGQRSPCSLVQEKKT